MPYKQETIERIGQCAVTSLLYEVAATPKPGLVDRANNGSHHDMDFFRFMASAAALSPYFFACARQGAAFEGEDCAGLFLSLRQTGMQAEQSMLRATDGVNTHKGLIFSLGVISAAAAFCHKGVPFEAGWNADCLCETVSSMTRGLCAQELGRMDRNPHPTHGERLYREFGLTGVRGEAESGFKTVRIHALPVFTDLMNQKTYPINDILVQTLLYLIAVNDDTNLAARGGLGALCYAKDYASSVLASGGALTPAGMEQVHRMDRDFIERNISPGGSADLLAVTVMLYLLAPPSAG